MSMGGGGDLKGIDGPGGGMGDSLDSETSYLKAPKTDSLLPSGLSLSLMLLDKPGTPSWGWDCGSNSDGNEATNWGLFIPDVELLINELNCVGV